MRAQLFSSLVFFRVLHYASGDRRTKNAHQLVEVERQCEATVVAVCVCFGVINPQVSRKWWDDRWWGESSQPSPLAGCVHRKRAFFWKGARRAHRDKNPLVATQPPYRRTLYIIYVLACSLAQKGRTPRAALCSQAQQWACQSILLNNLFMRSKYE